MTGNVKGEVSFEAGGTSYTLFYSINAIIALEASEDKTIQKIGEMMKNNPRIAFLRTVFHAGLRDHHKDLTEEDAGQIMQAAGGLATAGTLIGEAFNAAFATPEAEQTDEVPPKAAPEAA